MPKKNLRMELTSKGVQVVEDEVSFYNITNLNTWKASKTKKALNKIDSCSERSRFAESADRKLTSYCTGIIEHA